MRGSLLLLLVVCSLLAVDIIGRYGPEKRAVPAFFVEKTPKIQIALEGDWVGRGIYQISDGLSFEGVINMTGLEVVASLREDMKRHPPLQTGERYILQVVDGKLEGVSRCWMSASQRIALGIPLHPDRMTVDDWDCLPGIGKRLATVIEADRQNNGDFGSLDALRRVKGIGAQRLRAWRKFF